MSGRYRGAGGVDKLLRLARADLDAKRLDLAEIERARGAAEQAMADIDAALARETAADDPVAFGAYRDAAAERRFNLRKTLHALDDAHLSAQSSLQSALAEVAKLDRLAEVNARDAHKAAIRREMRSAPPLRAAPSYRR